LTFPVLLAPLRLWPHRSARPAIRPATWYLLPGTWNLVPGGLVGGEPAIDWAAIMPQAEAILTPAQMETLEATIESDRVSRQLMEMTMSLIK
jgi:hypothetical protein